MTSDEPRPLSDIMADLECATDALVMVVDGNEGLGNQKQEGALKWLAQQLHGLVIAGQAHITNLSD